MKHFLKTWPEHFKEVKAGAKTFEVRKDDRNFQVGDELDLLEWDPDKAISYDGTDSGYSGKSILKTVTYILKGGNFGIEEGFCVMGIK